MPFNACGVVLKPAVLTGLPRLERKFKARNDTGFIFRLPESLFFSFTPKYFQYVLIHCLQLKLRLLEYRLGVDFVVSNIQSFAAFSTV